jgi:hypothetical protein
MLLAFSHLCIALQGYPSSDRAVYSHTSAREAAICRPSPFVHVDYFFSNLTLRMTAVGIVVLYNNLKSTFLNLKTS